MYPLSPICFLHAFLTLPLSHCLPPVPSLSPTSSVVTRLPFFPGLPPAPLPSPLPTQTFIHFLSTVKQARALSVPCHLQHYPESHTALLPPHQLRHGFLPAQQMQQLRRNRHCVTKPGAHSPPPTSGTMQRVLHWAICRVEGWLFWGLTHRYLCNEQTKWEKIATAGLSFHFKGRGRDGDTGRSQMGGWRVEYKVWGQSQMRKGGVLIHDGHTEKRGWEAAQSCCLVSYWQLWMVCGGGQTSDIGRRGWLGNFKGGTDISVLMLLGGPATRQGIYRSFVGVILVVRGWALRQAVGTTARKAWSGRPRGTCPTGSLFTYIIEWKVLLITSVCCSRVREVKCTA